MIKFLAILFLLFPSIAYAGTYWVHPYGTAANWAACSNATDPGGTCVEGNCANYCTLTQANTASNTVPGDIIKLKGGTYNTHIYPGESGTAEARLTYEAVTGETPIIINTATTYATYYHGINLTSRSYITIRGVTVGPDTSSTMNRLMMITNGASYNELDSCKIYGYFGGEMIKIYDNVIGDDDTPCTHNWIHDSTIANNMKLYNCAGGVCEYMGMQIGDSAYDHGSGYNTIEDNIFYMNGHHNLETFTKNNIIRNNFFHQAPGLTEETDGTPAYTPDSNSKYGHRNIQIYGADGTNAMYNFIEGNLLGPVVAAPENDGADGFTLTCRGNIVRYNDVYGAQNNGILLKYGDASSLATNNRIYNNTVYGSGRYQNTPQWQGVDLRWYVSSGNYGTANVIKNNIFYGGASGDFAYGGQETGILAANTVINNWLAASGDPLFTDAVYPDIDSAQSTADTDFTLTSSSPAINGGTYLTTVHADDTSSGTSLIVEDALYFQDGTWGSSLAGHTADWICVGATVVAAECFQIGAINYDTNTITVADFTRADGEYVWLYKKSDGVQVLYGSAPDYGAHEYSGAGYGGPGAKIGTGPAMKVGTGAGMTIN